MTNGLRQLGVCTSLAFLFTVTGCTSWFGGGGGALKPDKYQDPNPPGTVLSRHEVIDQPGAMYDQVRVLDVDPDRPGSAKVGVRPNIGGRAGGQSESVQSVSPAAQEMARRTPTAGTFAAPTTLPEQSLTSGQYMTVGAVVVTVNDMPVYADKVLGKLSQALAAEAKQRDANSFRVFAADIITRQVRTEVQNELVFAAAQKALDDSEKQLADAMTIDWRKKEIIQHGGSLEQTRAYYTQQGVDFDDVLQDKYREFIVAIYYQKRIFPKVQVTADDMRRYYERNRDKQFTETEQATFRLIKVDPRKVGSKEDALKRAEEVLQKARAGEDFQLLASEYNNDDRLKRAGGLEQPIRKGEYANTKVEEAVFTAPLGQVTDIIESGNAFYIAKVEQRGEGRVRPFEDPAVQAEIKDVLRKQQMGPMIDRAQARLLADAIINPDPPNIQPVLEMAMQKYQAWKGS